MKITWLARHSSSGGARWQGGRQGWRCACAGLGVHRPPARSALPAAPSLSPSLSPSPSFTCRLRWQRRPSPRLPARLPLPSPPPGALRDGTGRSGAQPGPAAGSRREGPALPFPPSPQFTVSPQQMWESLLTGPKCLLTIVATADLGLPVKGSGVKKLFLVEVAGPRVKAAGGS